MLSGLFFALVLSLSGVQADTGTPPAEFLDADRTLNETYKATMSAIPAESQAKLKAAQLAWIPYRDLSSELERQLGSEGGDGNVAYNACMTHLTRQQVEWLTLIRNGEWRARAMTFWGHAETVDGFAGWLAESDLRLNRAYKDATDHLTPEVVEKLKAIQRAWITYRDLMSDFQEAVCPVAERKQVYRDAIKEELTNEQGLRLAAIGMPRDLEGVKRVLGKGDNPYQNGLTLGALATRGRPVVPLLTALARDNKELQESVVGVLGRMGPEAVEAIPLLRDALMNRLSGGAQSAAPRALARMGDPGLAVMLEALSTANKETTGFIVSGFEAAGPSAVPALMKAFEQAGTDRRPRFVQALGTVGPAAHEATPMLIAALKDGDPALRASIAEALGCIGEPRETVQAALIAMLDEPDSGKASAAAKHSAAWALARFKHLTPEALAALERALRQSGAAAKSAAEGLAFNGSDEAVALLIRLSRDTDADVRGRAINGLGRVAKTNTAATEALAAALGKSSAGSATEATATALSQAGDAALPTLLNTLKDPKCTFVSAKDLRRAFDSVGICALEPLRELLRSEDAAIRAKAALATSAIEENDGSCTAELIPMLSGKDRQAVLLAAQALQRLGPRARQAIGPLRDLCKSEDEAIAKAAQMALTQIGPEVEGVDYRLTSKAVDAERPQGATRLEWALIVDGVSFFLSYLDVGKETRWHEREGFDVTQFKIRWVAPGDFLEVFWGTHDRGSGRYVAYSTLLLQKTEKTWREIFRHSGNGYTRGGANDSNDTRWEFVHDSVANALVLREIASGESRNGSFRYVSEWPCRLSGNALAFSVGKRYEELEEPMTLEKYIGTLDAGSEKLRKLNPSKDKLKRVLTDDSVPAFEPYTGVLLRVSAE